MPQRAGCDQPSEGSEQGTGGSEPAPTADPPEEEPGAGMPQAGNSWLPRAAQPANAPAARAGERPTRVAVTGTESPNAVPPPVTPFPHTSFANRVDEEDDSITYPPTPAEQARQHPETRRPVATSELRGLWEVSARLEGLEGQLVHTEGTPRKACPGLPRPPGHVSVAPTLKAAPTVSPLQGDPATPPSSAPPMLSTTRQPARIRVSAPRDLAAPAGPPARIGRRQPGTMLGTPATRPVAQEFSPAAGTPTPYQVGGQGWHTINVSPATLPHPGGTPTSPDGSWTTHSSTELPQAQDPPPCSALEAAGAEPAAETVARDYVVQILNTACPPSPANE